MPHHPVTRRSFLSAGPALGAAATLSAAAYARVLGANERINVGIIGFGLIGKRHVLDFKAQPDVRLAGAAEAHRGRLAECQALIGENVPGHADFRRLLDDRDINAVVISTPDHWHAMMTMLACAAGKDVYVEKPLTLFVQEGRWMIDVARRHQRVVQVGTQQRSGKHYQRARELIRSGAIGKVVSVRMQSLRNITPGFGNPPAGDPPPDLDWNLWLGPAPLVPYNANRGLYHFRWFWDYSGGQMTNLGAHSLDIVDWILGLETLKAVTSAGGRYALTDNGQTPDTQDAIFEFDGWTAAWSLREASRGRDSGAPLEFHGTKGTLGITRSGFTITGDPDIPAVNQIPTFADHPVGGPQSVPPTGPRKLKAGSLEDKTGDSRAQFTDHVRNFLDCMRSRREPISDLPSAHRVSIACHLANLSLRSGRKALWDAAGEKIVGDRELNAQLTRPYRAPWDRELSALLG